MTAATDRPLPLTRAEDLAADAVGDFIEHWGFRKALGRIWTVLYLAGEPLPAAELQRRLQMSTGAVSMSLAELQTWGVVRKARRPGERRTYFEAETDFWKMISRVIDVRERQLARSIRERLRDARDLLARTGPRHARERERLGRLLSFATIGESVIDTFLASRRADFSGFVDVLARVRPSGRRG
jgi:DNA-binding transcriptional regulator GbsR (MarR family)